MDYRAHQELKASGKKAAQDAIRAKNLAMIREEQRQSAENVAKFDRFIKVALLIVIGLFIALLLKEYGVWL